MRRSSRVSISRLAGIASLGWPWVPVLAVWPGAWLVHDGAVLAMIVLFWLGPLWCLVGLAACLGLGLAWGTPHPGRPAWVRRAPWVGAALNGAALFGWGALMLRGWWC